jgi:uncharacterized protein (UPF0333 family)
MTKKGQAAMEFLMTYGWAILVVLIAIGALAYFGVLNPGRFLPASCTITPGISCEDFKADSTANTVTLVLRNGIGDDLTNVVTNIYTPDTTTELCTAPAATTLSDGEKKTFTATACTTGSVGSRFRADIAFTYNTSSGIQHTKTGSITTQVE